jgi:hypothetical protein
LLSLDPQAESDAVLEMGLGSLPGVGQAMAVRDLERARRAKDPSAAAMAASNFIPFGTLLNRFRRGPMSELDVYHGTPHRFDPTEENPLGEFDASRIGTGEGVQAYGHGIYLAEDPDVAKTYQSAQSPSARKATMTLQASDGNVNKAIAAMKKEVATMTAHKDSPYLRQGAFQETQDALNYLQQMKKGAAPQTGALYTADLPDEMIDRMLDWDKPLSEQSPAIKKAMGSRYENWKNSTGQDLYETLSEGLGGDKVTSDWLRENNIPGIRYLDADKRLGGSGTRNFVVFPGEEKKVKILEKK